MKNRILLFIAVLGLGVSSAFAQRDENRNGGGTDYSNAKVYFTNDVADDGTIGDPGTTYNINKKKGSYLYCIISNYPTPLGIEGFKVSIYKAKSEDDDFSFVEDKSYTISNTTKTTYFKYTFYEKGYYKFKVSTKDGVAIGTGYVTIKYN
jgi:hypothetical protein